MRGPLTGGPHKSLWILEAAEMRTSMFTTPVCFTPIWGLPRYGRLRGKASLRGGRSYRDMHRCSWWADKVSLRASRLLAEANIRRGNNLSGVDVSAFCMLLSSNHFEPARMSRKQTFGLAFSPSELGLQEAAGPSAAKSDLRPIALLRLSLLRFVDSRIPRNPLWTWEFHPLS